MTPERLERLARRLVAVMVSFDDIANAIKKTLEFVVTDGNWRFEPKTYGLSGIKTITVAGHFYSEKGHFFLTANAIANKPIQSYESATGKIDANSKVEIIGNLFIFNDKNASGSNKLLEKIAERSYGSGDRLNTPYELAQWVKSVIDNYGKPGDDDDDDDVYDPTPIPSSGVLVGV